MAVFPKTKAETSRLSANMHRTSANTIHVGGKPKSISFSGCGFLGVFHIGVGSCLKQHAPALVKNLDRIYGCSAGSMMGAMLLSDVCFGEVCQRTMAIVMDARSRYLGPLSPGFKLNESLIRDLRTGLPPDAHIRATGKLFISLTRVHDGKNVIVSDYKTREELIQVLICSSFVPFYSGLIPPKYRGVRYVDGGLSNNLPADHDTITVSPWSGNSDICPRNDGSTSLVDLSFVNTSIQMTASNMYRLSTMFFPPNPEVLKEFCCLGFRETVLYLRDHGLFETVHPMRRNLSFSSHLHEVAERRRKTRRMSCTARSMTHSDLLEVDETSSDTSPERHSVSSQSSDVGIVCNLTSQPLEECFDENDNERDVTMPTEIAKPRNVYTVIHLESDHVVRVEFQLPTPVLEALESAFEQSGRTWKKPLSRLLSTCRQSFVIRIPLEKTYSTACFLLRHSSSFPDDVRWLVDHVRHLVDRLHRHCKCSGQFLVEKLRNSSLKAKQEIMVISEQMTLAVQILIKSLLSRGFPFYPAWLLPSAASSTCKPQGSGNVQVSPFLQIL